MVAVILQCLHLIFFFLTNHSNALFRQGVTGLKQHKHDPERRTRESRAVPAPDANAELVSSLQVIVPFVDTFLWRCICACLTYHFKS